MKVINNHNENNVYNYLKSRAKEIVTLDIYSAYASDYGIVKLLALKEENNFKLKINVANRDFLDNAEISFARNVGDEELWTENFHEWLKSVKVLTKNNEIIYYEMQDSDFHGKCYFITYKNGNSEAIIGSANATIIGMSGTTNNEINVVTNFSKEELIPVVKESERTPFKGIAKIDRYVLSPKEFYENALNLKYKNHDKTISYWNNFEAKPAFKNLRKAQQEAFRICVERMDNVGPIFVSYATGFGKTRLYIALFCYYTFNKIKKRNVVIVGPKKLRDHIDNEAKKMLGPDYEEFSTELANCFVSYDQPRESENSDSTWKAKEWKATLKRGDVFIFEEAHNLRNTKTQRYKNIYEQLKDNPASICYVTATPIVKQHSEILGLLRICEQREQSYEVQEKLDHVNSLRNTYNTNNKKFIEDLKLFNKEFILSGQKIDEKRETIEDYPKFEVDRIFYNYADKYDYLRDFYDDKGNYLLSPGIGNHLSKWMLLQLFDSSSEAFITSSTNKIQWMNKINTRDDLEKELNKNQETMDFIEAQDGFEDWTSEDKNIIVEETIAKSTNTSQRSKITDAEFNNWLKQKPTTIAKLQEMQKIALANGAHAHNKLEQLEKRLLNIYKTKGADAAILIFVNFKDSATFLQKNIENNSNFKNWNIETITHTTTGIMNQIERFNLKNNNNKINVLIATPLLSEGFDLYNGTDVINYDLTWNPTDLIQRIGRIYRFTTSEERKNETIKIHNCYCEDEKFVKTITYELKNDEKIDQIDMIAPEFNVKVFFDDDAKLAHKEMLKAFSSSFDQNYLHEYLSIDTSTKAKLDRVINPTITYWETNAINEGIYFISSVANKFYIPSINTTTKKIVLSNSEKFQKLSKKGIFNQNYSTQPTIEWLRNNNIELFSPEDIFQIFFALREEHHKKTNKKISMDEFKIHSVLIARSENE